MKFGIPTLLACCFLIGSCQSLPAVTTIVASDGSSYPENSIIQSWQDQVFLQETGEEIEGCPNLGEVSLKVLAKDDPSCKKEDCDLVGEITWTFFGEREEKTLLKGQVDDQGNYRFASIADERVSDSFGQFGDNAVSATLNGSSDCFSYYTLVKS